MVAFKAKGTDPDLPLCHQAVLQPDVDEFVEAQGIEMQTLEAKDTSDSPPGVNVPPGAWTFCIKPHPNNQIKKYKVCFW